MLFCEKLNEYISAAGCSSKDICVRSGISAPTLSRYRSGERVPDADSDAFKNLCTALSQILSEKSQPKTPRDISDGFMQCENITLFDRTVFSKKLGELLSILNISPAKLGKYTHYDESSVFRFKNATRQPSDPIKFASDTAKCVCESICMADIPILTELTGKDEGILTQTNGVYLSIREWLLDNKPREKKGSVECFLEKLDSFDLNEYIKAIKFDEIKIPTMPFTLPTSKYYYGIKQMMACEIDFLKATALSKSAKDVTMYSDMPMTEMAKDKEFAKKWLTGIAILLKKGLTLNQIHDLNRPFDEMMIGLEGWIPMYMTGQIKPYYFENGNNGVFSHILRVSGSAALSGEAVSGIQSDGRYYLSKTKEDIAYYSKYAQNLISQAKPLMDIYREDAAEQLNKFISDSAEYNESRRNILSSPPLYTMSEKLLDEILNSNGIGGGDRDKIKKFRASQLDSIEKILDSSTVTDEISVITDADFNLYPMTLPLADIFFGGKIKYTYTQYLEHMRQCAQFVEQHENYEFKQNTDYTFRNLQIHICSGAFVHIAKSNAPAIHFIIKHPKLIDALMNYTRAPIITEE